MIAMVLVMVMWRGREIYKTVDVRLVSIFSGAMEWKSDEVLYNRRGEVKLKRSYFKFEFVEVRGSDDIVLVEYGTWRSN